MQMLSILESLPDELDVSKVSLYFQQWGWIKTSHDSLLRKNGTILKISKYREYIIITYDIHKQMIINTIPVWRDDCLSFFRSINDYLTLRKNEDY